MDKTLAIVNYGFLWGELSGKGFLVLMQKKGDEWVILYAEKIWVS